MKRILRLLFTMVALVILVACSSGGVSNNSNNDSINTPDPETYQDPVGAVEPGPIVNPTVAPAMSLGAPNEDGLIEVNVSGLAGANTSGLSTLQTGGLSKGDFTLIEGGVVKGISVRRISSIGGSTAADIVFVLDTTSSMGPGLMSVVNSIKTFTDYLADNGLDARVGAITFGDAFDTHKGEASNSPGESFMGEVPPDFEANLEERASYQLTDDYEAFMQYLTYEAGGTGRDGGDVPENALGALEYAFDGAPFEWRAGAQKHFVVITDACSHNEDTAAYIEMHGPWVPSTISQVVDKIRGHAQVHVIEPETPGCTFLTAEEYSEMKDFTGINATGGVYVEWQRIRPNEWGTFDLTSLPITTAMTTGGYIVTYRGTLDGSTRTVRLVVDDGSNIRGEVEVEATY